MTCETLRIGIGRLNWRRCERIGDRYGSVCLIPEEDESTFDLPRFTGFGKLIATIKMNRKSGHIGDVFHGFFPSTPEIGESIELGEGNIFYERDEFGDMVGLKPHPIRETFWLNPEALYKCHNQTVALEFQPIKVNKDDV